MNGADVDKHIGEGHLHTFRVPRDLNPLLATHDGQVVAAQLAASVQVRVHQILVDDLECEEWIAWEEKGKRGSG